MNGLELNALHKKCPNCGSDNTRTNFKNEDQLFPEPEKSTTQLLFHAYERIYESFLFDNFHFSNNVNYIEKNIKPNLHLTPFPFYCFECSTNFILNINFNLSENKAHLIYVLDDIIRFINKKQSEKIFKNIYVDKLRAYCTEKRIYGYIVYSIIKKINNNIYLLLEKLQENRKEIQESLYHPYIPIPDIVTNIGINVTSGLITAFLLWILTGKQEKDPLCDSEVEKIADQVSSKITLDDIERSRSNPQSKYYNVPEINVRRIASDSAKIARDEIKEFNIDEYR